MAKAEVVTKKPSKAWNASKVGVVAAAASGGIAMATYCFLNARKKKNMAAFGTQADWHVHFLKLKYEPEHFAQDADLFDLFGMILSLSDGTKESFEKIRECVLAIDSLLRIEYVLRLKDEEPTFLDLDRAMLIRVFIARMLEDVKNLTSVRTYNAIETAKTRVERGVLQHVMVINSLVYDCD